MSDRIAVEIAEASQDVAVAKDEAGEPVAAQACPDVEALVRELAALLEDPNLMTAGYFDGWLLGQANDLDAHCARILEGIAQDVVRRPVEQIAASRLLVELANKQTVASLSAAQRSVLWQAYDVSQPSPVIPADADADVLLRHRSEIAAVAGACLAVLGERGDLEQLVERLGKSLGYDHGLAARSLSHASSTVLAELLLVRLSDPTLTSGQMVQAIAGLSDHPEAFQAHPELRARAAQALSDRWRAEAANFMEVRAIDRLLSIVDPELRADRWGEALDQGTAGQNLHLATEALIAHGAPRDLERIDGLLARGSEHERLAAARAVVGAKDDGDASKPLRHSACAALAELVRSSPTPLVRRQALLAARKVPDVLAPVALEALEDEDADVRESAVIALRALPELDPTARARLELAAQSDLDPRVRKAADQALH
jgi:hypothetical protein